MKFNRDVVVEVKNEQIILNLDLEKSGFIKTRLKCKGSVTTYDTLDEDRFSNEKTIFVKDKWYDAWVRPYKDEHSQKINGGGYQDHVLIDEFGKLRHESKPWMRASFYYTPEDQRDAKLEDLTK